jgi:hypothetical protein
VPAEYPFKWLAAVTDFAGKRDLTVEDPSSGRCKTLRLGQASSLKVIALEDSQQERGACAAEKLQ